MKKGRQRGAKDTRRDPPAAASAPPGAPTTVVPRGGGLDALLAIVERRAGAIAFALLALLALQGILFIAESSQTSDEAAHLSAGYSYLTRWDFRLNPEHPPLIKELAALPLLPLGLNFPDGALWQMEDEWNIGRLFVHENRLPNDTLLFLARVPTLALSILLGWVLYRVGRRLFGAAGALLALALWILDPNVVANSGLVTTDLGITLFIFLAAVALRAWIERPDWKRLLSLGLATGGAFAAKYTALWLPPILAGLALSVLLRDPGPAAAWSAPRARRFLRLVAAAPFVLAVAAFVVALTYGFSGLHWWAVGLQRTLHHSAIGHRAWLMGEISETGWWYYFPLAFLWKTPPGTLLILAGAVVAFALGRRLPAREEWFLLVPTTITLLIVSVWKVNIGLRHLLPIYPFLFLFAGRLLIAGRPAAPAGADGSGVSAGSQRPAPSRTRAVALWPALLVAAGLLWNIVEAARITPYQLAYFNFITGGPAEGHKYLLDSNDDWGQAHKALKRYLDAEGVPMIYCAFTGNSDPWYYGVRYQYAPGSGNMRSSKERPVRMPVDAPRELFAINPMVLHSLHFSDQHLYDWLNDYKPIARPGYAWFVYDITKDANAHAWIAGLCLSFGQLDLAEDQARRTLSFAPGNEMAQAVLQKVQERRASPEAPPGPEAPQRP